MAQLISDGSPNSDEHALGAQTIIGRYSFCDIVVHDKNISRQHARITRADGVYYIEDLNSLNGTFVNGVRIGERTQLYDQDQVRVYETGWVFQDASSPSRLSDDSGRGITTLVAGEVKRADARIVSAVSPRARKGDREKLDAVLQMTRSLSGSLGRDSDVLDSILEGVFALFAGADRGSILLLDEQGELVVRAFRQADDPTNADDELTPAMRSLAERVVRTEEAVLSSDDLEADDDSVFAAPRRSVLCAPLLRPDHRALGVLQVEASGSEASFDDDDLEVLLSVAAISGQAIEFARAHQAMLVLDRQQRELAMAHQVQMHFLPRQEPKLDGYEFLNFYESAFEVGGDYFGYVPLGDHRLAVAVGDVSGKGISSALMMARLCAEVPYSLATTDSVSQAIERLSREMLDPTADHHFITFVLGVLDAEQHVLTLANAGHLPPLLRRARDGDVEWLGEGGLPLGVAPIRTYTEMNYSFEPGDTLLFFTDGITEAMNVDEEAYGLPRLEEFARNSSLHGRQLGRAVLADVRRFTQDQTQSDDICLVCVHRQSTTA